MARNNTKKKTFLSTMTLGIILVLSLLFNGSGLSSGSELKRFSHVLQELSVVVLVKSILLQSYLPCL